MAIPLYMRVRLKTDSHHTEGAPVGTVGYVIEAYDDGAYEVEVSDQAGITVAQFVAQEDELAIDE